MLPGVGIFGSDPVCKVLIQILKHFDFEINAIWTNFYEFDAKKLIDSTTSNGTSSPSIGSASSSSSSSTTTTGAANKANNYAKLITTSIDSVLLNKNVNLVFVCCQPNLHSQISTKALGIGKNVICLFPTCKNIEDIEQMIQSARYYPSLMSSVNYGGLKYLAEFRLVKQSLPLIGELKVCNINISCQNLAVARGLMYKKQQPNSQQESQQIPPSASSSISNLIDHIAILASGSNASASLNWLIDKDLGAGLLNRFGAAMISLVLNLFDDKKCTRVLGSVRTFLEDIAPLDSSKAPHAKAATNGRTNGSSSSSMRKITADDFCTFQMNLEPGSVLVNVTLNSLTHSKYSQELLFCGTKGILAWSNSRIVYRSTSKDSNNNISPLSPGVDIVETELHTNETVDKSAEVFLNSYKNMEDRHPELPLIFIRGLYHYLEHVKKEFVELDKLKKSQATSSSSSSSSSSSKSANTDKQTPKLENFEHTRIVQMIVKSILTSSNENRWVTVNY